MELPTLQSPKFHRSQKKINKKKRAHHNQPEPKEKRLTALGEELREDVLEGVLVDVARRALLLEAPIDHLYLLAGEARLGREGRQLLRPMAQTDAHANRAP